MITACGFPGGPPRPQATVFIETTSDFSANRPQRRQQFLMNPAKPAITHDHQLVACTSLFNDLGHQFIHIVRHDRRYDQAGTHLMDIPGQIVGLVDPHRVGIG